MVRRRSTTARDYRPRGTRSHTQRKAAVAVQVAISLTLIVGFTGLTVDVGAMYNAKSDLQRAVDAAALAAASKLAAYDEGDPLVLAREQADTFVGKNEVFGQELALAESDVTFGRAIYDDATESYTFTETSVFPDAVRVTLRMTEDSPNGKMPLYFARALGMSDLNVEAEAIAMMVPRDIAIVADLSASHTDDSELANYKNTAINLHAVWDGLPGGIGDDVSTWNGDEFPVDPDGSSVQMGGPAWGYFKSMGWGTQTINSGYDPTSDAGLVKLQYNKDWSDAQLETSLSNLGYSNAEIDAIMANDYDGSGAWDERVAVALGFARWDSGISGGLWESLGIPAYDAGNGNGFVGGGELTWVETFGDRSVSQSKSVWLDYINNYVASSYTQMENANSNFRYRFGLKTFTNYLMERRPSHNDTPELAGAPEQPMQAVKDAVSHLSALLDTLETNDLLSLEIYGTYGRHEVDLTTDYASVGNRLNEMQAGHYDSWTNMGGGIQRAIEELTSDRARPISRKVMILLTDGYANVNAYGGTGDYYGGESYALAKAADAAAQGIRVFAVSVGSNSDTDLMDEIAEIGSGLHFHAEGSIDDYSDQLEEIFATLGGTRPVELIQ